MTVVSSWSCCWRCKCWLSACLFPAASTCSRSLCASSAALFALSTRRSTWNVEREGCGFNGEWKGGRGRTERAGEVRIVDPKLAPAAGNDSSDTISLASSLWKTEV